MLQLLVAGLVDQIGEAQPVPVHAAEIITWAFLDRTTQISWVVANPDGTT